MLNKTVSAFWLKGILACAQNQGITKNRIFEDAGVISLPDTANDRVPLDATVKVWNSAIKLTKDPLFGFNMGKQFRPNWFNLIHHLWANSPDVRSAIDLTLKYQSLISDGGELALQESSGTATLQYFPKADKLPFSYHQTDAVLATLVSLMRWSIDDGFAPPKVAMQHSQKNHDSDYTEFFQCTVSYENDHPYLDIDSKWLDRTLIGADAQLLAMHLKLAEQKIALLGRDSLHIRIANYLVKVDDYQNTSKEEMASLLHTSSRTLQRKLSLENTCYSKVSDQVRQDLAHQLIKQNIPTTELTHKLGFSEVSSLHKACKRWFKMSLNEYRAKATMND